MKKWLIAAVVSGILLMMGSCMLMPSAGASSPEDLLKSVWKDLQGMYDKYKNDPVGLANAMKDFVKKYFYLDSSLSKLEGGEDEAVSKMAYSLSVILFLYFSEENPHYEDFDVKNYDKESVSSSDIPSDIEDEDKIDKKATVTFEDADGNSYVVTVIEVADKWYMSILFYSKSSGNSTLEDINAWPLEFGNIIAPGMGS